MALGSRSGLTDYPSVVSRLVRDESRLLSQSEPAMEPDAYRSGSVLGSANLRSNRAPIMVPWLRSASAIYRLRRETRD